MLCRFFVFRCPDLARGFAFQSMKSFLAVLLLCVPLSAGSIVTGGQLLNQTNANQLAAWLGQGDLTFTNVFSSAPSGTGAAAFHTAVDGIGPTFILIQTSLGLVGGYDPVSWGSPVNGAYTLDPTNAGRTAFIYNLSTSTLFSQLLVGQNDPTNNNAGQYQTFNFLPYGPTFGGGHDLTVNASDLGSGFSFSYSYGNGYFQPNLFGQIDQTNFTITRVEAFTFAQTSATPEPATFALCGGVLAVLGMVRRRRAASSKC